MNKVILMGRLTRDPEIRYGQGESAMAVARYTLAVDRRFKREGEQSADFLPCVAFSKNAEFAEKWLKQGIKIVVVGHIQTGSYTNKDGVKVYTTDIIVDEQEFAESKSASSGAGNNEYNNQGAGQAMPPSSQPGDGFMNIPQGIEDELPFQ